MKIAILSGKGGTGKTFVSVNLASVAPNSVYVDCDVEEPNGRLFLKATQNEKKAVAVTIPEFDEVKCIGCRKCVEFCKFNALAYVLKKPMVFKEVCHSCGGCALVCKEDAICEMPVEIGHVEVGRSENVLMVTGELNIGEASGVPVIRQALKKGFSQNADTIIIDCPPGSACAVTESIKDVDFCLIVAEPTLFGFYNFKMVHELVEIMKKPCAVVINKYDGEFPILEEYCTKNKLPIFAILPYDKSIAQIISEGKLATKENELMHRLFEDLYNKIGGALNI